MLLAAIPLHLRIHHYILALLLLPGTAIQTRPSLLYQGLLIGLFINGVARWGLASILQTENALRGDASRYGSLLPAVTVSPTTEAIGFQWEIPPPPYEGISVVVNDVERYRWSIDQGDLSYTRIETWILRARHTSALRIEPTAMQSTARKPAFGRLTGLVPHSNMTESGQG